MWIKCSDRLPSKDTRDCLVAYSLSSGGVGYQVVDYCEGWNCHRQLDGTVYRHNEFTNVVAWQEIEKYTEGE